MKNDRLSSAVNRQDESGATAIESPVAADEIDALETGSISTPQTEETESKAPPLQTELRKAGDSEDTVSVEVPGDNENIETTDLQTEAEASTLPQAESRKGENSTDTASAEASNDGENTETTEAVAEPVPEAGKPKKEKSEHGRRALVKELERLRADHAKLSSDYAQLKDRYLRLAAEMENFRKRVERDFSNRWENGIAMLFAELLPVVDDLERFFAADNGTKDYDALASGVRLIYQNILKILQNRGVVAMEAVGSGFDPTRHEAIYQKPVDGMTANIVVEENIKGYLLFDKVLRPAKVIVSA
jgi:molecular chaperone GrpE